METRHREKRDINAPVPEPRTALPTRDKKPERNQTTSPPRKKVILKPPKPPVVLEEFVFPPSNPNPVTSYFSKTGQYLNSIQTTNVEKLIASFQSGEPLSIFFDETNYYRLSIICIYLESLFYMYPNMPPVLILSQTPGRWLYFFQEFTKRKLAGSSANRQEKKRFTELGVSPRTSDFNIYISTLTSFQRESINMKIQWSVVVFDDAPHQSYFSRLNVYHKVAVLTYIEPDIEKLKQLYLMSPIKSNTKQKSNLTTVRLCTTPVISLRVPKPIRVDVSSIKIDDLAAISVFTEIYIKTPMTQLQSRNYHQLCLNFLNKPIDVCKMGSSLMKLCSCMQTSSDEIQPTGKLMMLGKLLQRIFIDDRKVAIFCRDPQTIATIHGYLVDIGIPHLKFDISTRTKQMQKMVDTFNDSEQVIICHHNSISTVLETLKADTIINFDASWVPTENAQLVFGWQSRVLITPAEIYRLITPDSFEEILFNTYWHSRDEIPYSLIGLKTVNVELLSSIIHTAIDLELDDQRKKESPVRSHNWCGSALKSAIKLEYADASALPKPRLIDPSGSRSSRPMSIETTISLQAPVFFWNAEKIGEVCRLLQEYGWGHWEKLSDHIGRPADDIMEISAALVRYCHPKGDTPRCLLVTQDFNNSDFRKFTQSFTPIFEQCGFDRLEFITQLEKLFYLDQAREVQLEPFRDGWTEDDDKDLIDRVLANGYSTIEDDIEPRVNALLSAARLKYDEENKPVLINIRHYKRFSTAEHEKTIRALMNYGEAGIDRLSRLTKITEDRLSNYIAAVLRYCQAPSDERKLIVQRMLAEKIPKYNCHKILQRVRLFEQLRALDRGSFSAEDEEFYRCILVHGFADTKNSPIMQSICCGSPTETKIVQRLKFNLAEKPPTPVTAEIDVTMPLVINECIVITEVGTFVNDPQWIDEDFVFLAGYKCSVLVNAQWIDCEIENNEGAPLFILHSHGTDTWKFEASGPDMVFQKLGDNFDGFEMFGLTSAVYRRVVQQLFNDQLPEIYRRRWFRSIPKNNHKWPVVGQWDKDAEKALISKMNLKRKQAATAAASASKKQKSRKPSEPKAAKKQKKKDDHHHGEPRVFQFQFHFSPLVEAYRSYADDFEVEFEMDNSPNMMSIYSRFHSYLDAGLEDDLV